MKKLAVLTAVFATVAVGAVPTLALAANARHPYSHVNHANDAGNRSGDQETARLNQQQLDQARAGR